MLDINAVRVKVGRWSLADPQVKLTAARAAILAVVREATDHPTAALIYDRVKQRMPHIAYATVYNALSALVAGGFITELSFGDGASRYDGRLEPHQHATCVRCGAVAELDMSLQPDWPQVAGQQTHFHLHSYQIQFFGLCPRCQEHDRAHP
jgi:Fur family peroxide stress response transcriptional regulator